MESRSSMRSEEHYNSNERNVYTQCEYSDGDCDAISSSKRAEHNLMNNFREQLNLHVRRESLNTSDNKMLDQDLGHPPAAHDAPPGSCFGSLQSDSSLSGTFRSRSRSDATTSPVSCRHSMGTIVLFPNRAEKRPKSHHFRPRNERHSVCVTDLPRLKNTNSFLEPSSLFVDTGLANDSVMNNEWHKPSSTVETRSDMWNSPVLFGYLTAEISYILNSLSCKYGHYDQRTRHTGSEPTSPFSKYAIVIKELRVVREEKDHAREQNSRDLPHVSVVVERRFAGTFADYFWADVNMVCLHYRISTGCFRDFCFFYYDIWNF
ncbi:unnamed protein product [Thelazia callipaeda]|uniref:Protein kinase domain-containing protein n=1 Tax=Thelazia callipaeda TaxID=103827 RepID=A0A0N5CW00_THECL|nr:unnamed protein product [Thelazia callipaeda]